MKTLAVIIGALQFVAVSARANGGENFPFHVGEKLTYQIFWGPFVVGRASTEVAGIEPVNGHDCYHLIASGKTTGFADLLFPVDDRSDSWLDVEQLFTRRYRQKRSEGGKHWDDDTIFDYDNKVAITTNLLKSVEKRVPIDGAVQDTVSTVYFVRSRPLKLREEQSMIVNANNQNIKVTVVPDERKSVWIRPLGDVLALRLEPKPTLKLVAANKGRMWIWISDDVRRLPLLTIAETQIGNARIVLHKIESANPSLDQVIRKDDTVASTPAPSATTLEAARH